VHESTVYAPIDNEGLLVVEGNHARFGGDFTNPAGATLRIQGSSGFGAGILTVANGFTNAGAIEMTTTASPASSGLQVLSGVLTNTGSLDLFPGAGTSNTLHFQLDNQGTFTTDANVVFAVEGASTNSGTFRVNGGVLGMGVFALGPSFTNTATGVMSVAASSTLEINNLLLSNFSGGTLTGGTYQIAGTLQFAVQYGDVMLTSNAARLLLDGPGSRILNQSGGDALGRFAANSAAGTFSLTNGRVMTTSGDLSNSGTVGIDASSQWSVSGNYTQTDGSTTVSGTLAATTVDLEGGLLRGTGTLDGSVVNAARIQVGDDTTVGTLTITGDYTQTAGGTLAVKVGGYVAGTDFDQLVVLGQAYLDGTLEVTLVGRFVPNTGDIFPVVAANTALGAFATLSGDGSAFDQQNDGSNLNLVSH
jgi:hypothetical protein